MESNTDKERRRREKHLTNIRRLYHDAITARPNQDFIHFVEFVGRFRKFSPFNAVLIYAQRPGAAAIASLAQWRELGREIQPDAIPIVILVPFGPVQWVYELSDTAGPDLPGDDVNPLLASGAVKESAVEELITRAKQFGIVVENGSYGAFLAGTAASLRTHKDRVQRRGSLRHPWWRVKLNGKLDAPTRFATLVHELGHICCGHLGAHPRGFWEDRRRLPRPLCEIEAETVSFLLCARAQIQTRSAEYLHEYLQGQNIKQPDIGRILIAVDLLEGRLSATDETHSEAQKPAVPPGQLSMFEPQKKMIQESSAA